MMKDSTAVILAGGKSTRMGTNKAFLLFQGKKLIEMVIETLTPLFPMIYITVKNQEEYLSLYPDTSEKVQIVQDFFQETHPLGGIYTGLSVTETDYAFVCACDMPFLNPHLITTLWEKIKNFDAVIPIFNNKPQPLCGFYSKNCLPAMKKMIHNNQLTIYKLFDKIQTRFIPENEVRSIDPEGFSFKDMDTLEEYESQMHLFHQQLRP